MYSNGNSSTCVTSPVELSSPTNIIAFLGSLVVLNSDSSVTFELTIVRVLSFRPDSPICCTPSISAYFHSPFLSVGSFLTSISNGIVSVSLYWPSVLDPTLIFLVTGSFVLVTSPRVSSTACPFSILIVVFTSCSPSSPFWSSTIWFGANVGSINTSVSNGIGSLSIYSTVPVKFPSPTSIISFTGAIVSTGAEVFVTTEFSIVIVYFSSPSTPFCTTLYSPFWSSLFTLTSTSNGFLLVYTCVPSVLAGPTFTILLTGAFVCFVSPSSDLVTWPFTIVCVTVVSSSPSSPSCSTFVVPGSIELSTTYSVSNSTALVFLVSRVPMKSAFPTSIISLTGAFVSFGSEVFVTFEFSIVIVYSSSPSTPFWTTLCSPFLSSGFTLTSTSNGFLLV